MKILTKLSPGPPQLYRGWINELSNLVLNWVPVFHVTNPVNPWIMPFFIPVFLPPLDPVPKQCFHPFIPTNRCLYRPSPNHCWSEGREALRNIFAISLQISGSPTCWLVGRLSLTEPLSFIWGDRGWMRGVENP